MKLPKNLRTLTFGDDFDQALQHVAFPDSLEELTFGESFHQSWEEVALPASLKSLKFGKRFIPKLEAAKLPENLECLIFASSGHAFDQSLRHASLPSHIQRLQTGSILVSA